MTNNLIIFSKNRACQLNLLLDSIKVNAQHLFDSISILYKSDTDYVSGYEKLKSKYSDKVNFVEEVNFKTDLMRLIDEDYSCTTFMVDDAVVFNKITTAKEDVLKFVLMNTPRISCFSLRLGLNCRYSHPANLHYTIGDHSVIGKYLMFDINKQVPGDFKYPLSTDGHIYRTNDIKNLLNAIPFKNPNTLEANIQHMVPSLPSMMMSFTVSTLVSIPANLVNDTFRNRHGLHFSYSEKELNDRYLNDEVIDLPSLEFFDINGPHKEIEYIFKHEHNN